MADPKNIQLPDANIEKAAVEKTENIVVEKLPAENNIEQNSEMATEKRPEREAPSALAASMAEGRLGEKMQLPGIGILSHAQRARQKEVEKVLAEGLDEIYLGLPAKKQVEFKTVGENTAIEISRMLQQAKIKINKIIDLIKRWLALIPGINQFFLDQEAKIKADKILELNHGLNKGE